MKKKYNVIDANLPCEPSGIYKKLDEAHHSMSLSSSCSSNNTHTYIVTKTKSKRLSHLEKRSSEVGEASPTEWQYQSFKSSSFVSTPSTLHYQTTTITPIIEHQKSVIQEKRMSLVQELNQALAEGVNKFVKVISASQTQKEDLKQEETSVKSKNLLKLLSKFFIKSKKEIINQNFKFGNSGVYTYK